MADQYQEFTRSALGRQLTKVLGLPRPATLRRHRPGAELVPGPVLLLGETPLAQGIASLLLGWGLDVRTHDAGQARPGAIVAVLDEVSSPEDLADPAMELSATLKSLARNGRVITVARPAHAGLEPAAMAARDGVRGLLRSLAHELRDGSTGNGIELADGLGADAPSLAGALRFLLSGRSAYVDGQFLDVSTDQGELPADPERPLAGKIAVVTGAARGIGAAIVDVLTRDGATVLAVDVPAAGEALARVANRAHGVALQLDVTRQDAGQVILDTARERFGRLDIVIHNAGITRDKLLVNMDRAKWESVLAVNLTSQLQMNRIFLEAKVQGLRIVSLASTSGIAGNRGQTNYAASKAGIMGMVQATAPLIAADQGSINAVAPGFIETDMTARMPLGPRVVGRLIMPSLQQGGLPVDVAEAVAFLASDAAGGINGETLRVCGQSLIGA